METKIAMFYSIVIHLVSIPNIATKLGGPVPNREPNLVRVSVC